MPGFCRYSLAARKTRFWLQFSGLVGKEAFSAAHWLPCWVPGAQSASLRRSLLVFSRGVQCADRRARQGGKAVTRGCLLFGGA